MALLLEADDMNEVFPKLYVGNLKAARNTAMLMERGITHILTVNNIPLPDGISSKFTYKYVHGFDLEFTDLLSHFEDCVVFIEDAMEHGGILIHCMMGCSRSATVAIAYIMQKRKVSFKKAFNFAKEQRPSVYPNEGFIGQLMLFGEMGWKIDPRNENYKRYRLKKLATRMQGQTDETAEFLPGDLTDNPTDSVGNNDNIYKCKKCRQALFRKSGCLPHTVGEGEAVFDWRGKMSTATSICEDNSEVCDKSLFIEPVKWMGDAIQVQEGKLQCPKCTAKLGSFVWYGERCPCGTWVAPAFHVQKSKVDEMKPYVIPVPRQIPQIHS